jgi:hypothetical protein
MVTTSFGAVFVAAGEAFVAVCPSNAALISDGKWNEPTTKGAAGRSLRVEGVVGCIGALGSCDGAFVAGVELSGVLAGIEVSLEGADDGMDVSLEGVLAGIDVSGVEVSVLGILGVELSVEGALVCAELSVSGAGGGTFDGVDEAEAVCGAAVVATEVGGTSTRLSE